MIKRKKIDKIMTRNGHYLRAKSDDLESVELEELGIENNAYVNEESNCDKNLVENELDTDHEDNDDDENDENENNAGDQVKIISNKKLEQNVRKDLKSICLLMFLYLLQGVPLGLTSSLPYILSSRKVSYADQGTFSFAMWPFSLKLLWAPIVDSVFVRRFGRRKSWLVPIQYLIGLFMLLFSNYTKYLLDGGDSGATHSSDIITLTVIFFAFTFLAATQDIAVDGWALTMLSKENVSWGSTCNSVGQTAGWFIGNVIFLTFESADFCNKNIRPYLGLSNQTYGLITIDKFMNFFGILFIISTTLVMIFKKEKDSTTEIQTQKTKAINKINEEDLSIRETYGLMWKIIWLMPIKKTIIILMTVKICFAAESMSFLKLIEAGVPKEKLGLLAVPLTPLQIVLPLLISRYTNGPKPFNFFIRAIPFRLVMSLVVALLVYVTPYFKDSNGEFPLYYFAICLLINCFHSVFAYSMFVSQMSFFAQISDKTIGGTYMTFLNTLSNLGGMWPSTAALYAASFLTVKQCTLTNSTLKSNYLNQSNLTHLINQVMNNTCSSDLETKDCESSGGFCLIKIDAFYIETIALTLFGVFWILKFKSIMYSLQSLPKKSWKISKFNRG